jgi:competence protein ComEA
MTEHRSVRFGILGVVAALALGLVWLGIVRYQAEQRAGAAALPAPVAVAAPAATVDLPVAAPAPAVAKITVHVAGAVVKPGVYQLDKGARVADAIAAAGGALPEGMPDALNLAALVEDGQKVFVSTKQELSSPPPPAAREATYTPYAPPAAAKAPAGKVNVNTATAEQLDQVSGISPALAKAIVDYRTQHGPFKKLDDLDNVKGVGAATLLKLKEHLTL